MTFRYWLARNLRALASRVEPTIEPALGHQALWWSDSSTASGGTTTMTFPCSPENPYR